MRLKGKLYRSAVSPTMLCGSKCWDVDRRIKRSTSVAKKESALMNKQLLGSIPIKHLK